MTHFVSEFLRMNRHGSTYYMPSIDWSLFPVSIWQYPSIGPDNGLTPNRRQGIIWTNDGKVAQAYMRHWAWMGKLCSRRHNRGEHS